MVQWSDIPVTVLSEQDCVCACVCLKFGFQWQCHVLPGVSERVRCTCCMVSRDIPISLLCVFVHLPCDFQWYSHVKVCVCAFERVRVCTQECVPAVWSSVTFPSLFWLKWGWLKPPAQDEECNVTSTLPVGHLHTLKCWEHRERDPLNNLSLQNVFV